MDHIERVSTYAARQRRAAETTDWFKYIFCRAKHRDFGQMKAELSKFRSPLIDGILHKGAIAAGTAHAAGWASEMQDFQTLASEWLIATSAKSFIGQLPYRRVPFLTRTLTTIAPEADFVGTGKAIPMAMLNLADSLTLTRTTVGTIAAVSNELLDTWQPGTRENLDAVLTLSLIRGMDAAALDPDRAAVAGERPASLLNGVAPIALLGATVSAVLGQVQDMLEALVDGGSDLDSAMFVMHPYEAIRLSSLVTTEGALAFPQLSAVGGSVLGIPAVVSVGAGRSGSPSERVFAVVDGAQIAVADEGGISINTSRVADINMVDTSTMNSNDGTPTTVVSMFQTETTGIKLIRTINWERLTDSAVAWCSVTA